jgi:hypothetical protein
MTTPAMPPVLSCGWLRSTPKLREGPAPRNIILGSPPQRPLAFAVPTTHEFIFEIAGVPVLAFFCASMSSVFAQVSLELGLS